jgi:hypothetical protein
MGGKALLSAGSVLFSLFLLEGLVAATGLDFKLAEPLLYYQVSMLNAFRAVDDAELMFETVPNVVGPAANGDTITLNPLGYRGTPHRREKAPGVFRIICFGGSNTFGPAVGDRDTYPAYLEAVLNERSTRPVEVWNAGVPSQELRQNVRAAEKAVRELQPDLLVFEHHNRFRRAFLKDAPVGPLLRKNPSLYPENLPFLPFAGPVSEELMRSALWRTAVFALNRLGAPRNHSYDPDAEHFARFKEFRRRHPKLPMFAFAPLENTHPVYAFESVGVPFFRLSSRWTPDMPDEFRKLHPPAHVYRWYARELAEQLISRGMVPVRRKA